MADHSDLDALASAIADGQPVDWDALEASAETPSQRALLRNLRALADIAILHRSEDHEAGAPPERWAHLELRGRVGGGSFGDVYRAWDANLDREVALKLAHTGDPATGGRRTAGLGEARLLARVRHPNVVTVHGADEVDGRAGLWMEFIAGRTLREIVDDDGVFGPQEAIITGVALCRALGAIHAAGLVHGDIKAQNVMRERGGRIVLMDLGAARLLRAGSTAPAATGTPLYLAPEVLAGAGADPRSDIYSLGVVLFFVLTGTYPYTGRTADEVRDAQASGTGRSIRALRTDLPDALVSVVERCLASSPGARFENAAALERALAGCLGAQLSGHPVERRGKSRVLTFAAAVLVVGVAGWTGWMLRHATTTTEPPERLRTTLSLSPDPAPDFFPTLAISPRGTYVVYRGADRLLYVRRMNELTAKAVPESAGGVQQPFFSPDEKWLGYFAHGMVRKFSLVDGAVAALCPTRNPRGGTWTEDGWIVFAPSMYEGLWRVRESGGTAERITTPGRGEASHRWPAALPGGALAVTIWPANEDVLESHVSIYVPSTKAWHPVDRGSTAHYAGNGQLMLAYNGQLFATRYNPEAPGERHPLVPVQSELLTDERSGLVLYAASERYLLFVLGWLNSEKRMLTWVSRDGRVTPSGLAAHGYERPRISPRGDAFVFGERGRRVDVWHHDEQRGVMRRLTLGTAAEHESIVWSPDGSRLAYTEWTPGSPRSLILRAPGDTGKPVVINALPEHTHISQWSAADGLVLSRFDAEGRSDVVFVSPEPSGRFEEFVATQHDERDGRVSPDGQWVLYTSDESGRDEVYARERRGSRIHQVSADGGSEAIWHPNGREIFYRALDALMSVRWPISGEDAPVRLFKDRYERLGRREVNYDVSPDGSRFLFVEAVPTPDRPVHLVMGWMEELRARTGQ